MTENNENKLQRLLSSDPVHFYTDDELDAIEEVDAVMALRLAKVQHLAKNKTFVFENVEIDLDKLDKAIQQVRQILSMDGGDIEFIEIVDKVVNVRMKGACIGCPNAVMDLKNVVEKIVRENVPGVKSVSNVF